MATRRQHLRHVILYEYQKKISPAEAHRNINLVYANSVSVRTVQDWFRKFQTGDFSLEEKSRSGRPSVVDNDVLKTLVEADPRLTLDEMATKMECGSETIRRHLEEIGKVHKHGVWVPHKLSEKNKIQRSTISSSLLLRNNREPFLDRIITGDEKWVLYVNIRKRKQWLNRGQTPLPTPKDGIHPKKIMLCIWWDMRGVVHWEFLDSNLTITADIYCQQLDRLHQELLHNRPSLINRKGVILQVDNARPHIARKTQQKIHQLGWEVLPHPPYSPDMAPSDYHLFRSLQHYLSEKVFCNEEDIKTHISSFIGSKTPDFFKRGIENLTKRWKAVIENEGDYILQKI